MVSIGAIIYDFRQMSFNDAICFLEEARKLDKDKTPFAYWKYCTWSIIASAIFMESYVTSHIRGIIDEVEPSIVELYEESNLGFFRNIGFIEATFGSKINDGSDSEWKNIEKTIQIRNTIVHFKQVNISSYSTIENAEQGIKACRSFLHKLHSVMDIDASKLLWIDKTQCENYDIPK